MIKRNMKASNEMAKDLLTMVGGARTFDGIDLDAEDASNTIWCQRLWLAVIWDCQDRSRKSVLFGRFRQVAELINEVDVKELLTAMDLLDTLVLESTNARSLRRGLKARMKQTIRDVTPSIGGFVARLLGLLKRDIAEWVLKATPKALFVLHQVFCFQGRLPLKASNSVETALSKWWACETASVNHDFSVDPEVSIIKAWFSDNPLDHPEEFFPAHPSGACLETSQRMTPKTLAGKYAKLRNLDEKCLKMLIRLGYLDSDLSNLDATGGLMQNPFGQVGTIQVGALERRTRLLDLLNTTGRITCPVVENSNGITPVELDYEPWFSTCHILQDVPKNWKTKRIISMETAVRMWLQTGVKTYIFQRLKAGMSPLALHYAVNTEHWNQQAACEGSSDGNQATTDLSSASDCVRHKLVTKWFEKSGLGEILELCRSDTTLVPLGMYHRSDDAGSRVQKNAHCAPFSQDDYILWKTQKYMPMGGAICFPIEVVVFAAILENLCRRYPGVFRDYKVYGDDCVHDVIITELFHERLRELGFIPNSDKSFYNEPIVGEPDVYFRESCGAEWLCGTDVAPVRLPRKFDGFADAELVQYYDKDRFRTELSRLPRKKINAFKQKISRSKKTQCKRITGEIHLANAFFERNFTCARALVLEHLLTECKLQLPFSFNDPSKLLSFSPTNFHLKEVRWNFELQRFEKCALVPTAVMPKVGKLQPEVRLFEDLRSMAQNRRRPREGYHLYTMMPPEELQLSEPDPRNLTFDLVPTWIEVEVKDRWMNDVEARLLRLSQQEFTNLADTVQHIGH